jgi:hypothetical protein
MPNAVYGRIGTPQTWGDSGRTNTMTLSALATVAARVGARGDFGAFPIPIAYNWYLEAEWASAPTVDGQLELYLAGWDDQATPANPHGQVPSTDTGYAAASAGLSKRKNLLSLPGPVIETSAIGPFSAGGVVVFPYRYITPMIYNGGSVALATSTSKHFLRLTPVYSENQ